MSLVLVSCSQEPLGLTRPLNATDMEKGNFRCRQFLNGASKKCAKRKEKTTYNNKILLGPELREMQPVSS